jgi:aspartate ammonia-lyase
VVGLVIEFDGEIAVLVTVHFQVFVSYTEVSAALKVCMMNMSKIANDLLLIASGTRVSFNEISLPRASLALRLCRER